MSDKTIDTLLEDIASILRDNKAELNPENYTKFSKNIGLSIVKQISPEPRVRPENTVYASELGTQCLRQHYYKVNHPELAEPVGPAARVKFMYGNLLEELVLLLAKEAGHTVEREQEKVTYEGPGLQIVGRIDAVIDGCVVDVKSCSSYGFDKMVNRSKWEDSFGYQPQLAFYDAVTRPGRPRVVDGRFLLVEKVSGKLGFSYYEKDETGKIWEKAKALDEAAKVKVGALSRRVPVGHARGQVLDTVCSYCAFKKACWSDANKGKGLRVFNYAKGPEFFVSTFPGSDTNSEFMAREVHDYAKKQKEQDEVTPEVTGSTSP